MFTPKLQTVIRLWILKWALRLICCGPSQNWEEDEVLEEKMEEEQVDKEEGDPDIRRDSKENGEEDMEHGNESEEEWGAEQETHDHTQTDLKALYIYFHFIFFDFIIWTKCGFTKKKSRDTWCCNVGGPDTQPPSTSLSFHQRNRCSRNILQNDNWWKFPQSASQLWHLSVHRDGKYNFPAFHFA